MVVISKVLIYVNVFVVDKIHYFCRNCDIFVIVAAAVYRCAVKLYRVCKEERVYSSFKEEEGGWQKERGGREKEKKRDKRESNMARERENEREQVSKREKMTVGLFATPVSVSRTAVSDSPRSCGGGSSIIDPCQ